MKLDSKYFDSIRTGKKGRKAPGAGASANARPASARSEETPICQWDGCEEKGTHKAPVGRDAEGEYFLFCKDHVSRYNKGYNYFSGLSDSDIAKYQREAMTGHRPTWSMGVNKDAKAAPDFSTTRSASAASYARARMRDPFGFVDDGSEKVRTQTRRRKIKTLEAKAFETLSLAETAHSEEIKTQYKALVKKHHPDANGGDRGSEERFREVVQAYQLLKQAGFC
ncbi:J domain-containing protein [Pararhizobium mangrovi]|uniref:J domain-containing protein n=2 Tax=Pararhizobium mangrovi TaxID=2590452 RepID=A0A506U1E9_9HYPH|nr:J domain-containing protein [Pararhizobium mangrovi]